jgi:hypothetical protein
MLCDAQKTKETSHESKPKGKDEECENRSRDGGKDDVVGIDWGNRRDGLPTPRLQAEPAVHHRYENLSQGGSHPLSHYPRLYENIETRSASSKWHGQDW